MTSIDWPAIEAALLDALDNAPEGSTVRVHPGLYLFAQDHVETRGLTVQVVPITLSRDPRELQVVTG